MNALLQRIDWLVRNKANGNQRKLSEMAGLNPSHLSALVSRIKKDPDKGVELRTIVQLAQVTGVRFAWLAIGEGAPEEGSKPVQVSEWPPSMPQALMSVVARYSDRWPRELIADVAASRMARVAMTETDWFAYLTDRNELEKRYLRDTAAPASPVTAQRTRPPKRA